MEDKKAKFIVYIVIALIAFVCSSAVYSITGGLSDWIVSSINSDEDKDNNGYLDSSEGEGGIFSSFSSNDKNDNNYEDNNDSGITDKIFSKLFDSDSDSHSSSSSRYYSSSSSDDNPDLLARFLRHFISNG
ncbi:hypothetical protein [Methanobrevibacter olleyae]|uniref:Adhesin-like protein n=1 Tax=Methanobrevibacter olleyae TaxID=294671 RepID=A0A126QZX6_METOL|nr:hypothetical protein [Methanobrevibacter olleyae]AMK15357.1 adhesin-like protein [Methanobrevibacter olleyae]SFL70076.1 hypothetical protein SAMN02910297_01546 [Methanobrevibacter olleyae]